MNTVLKKFVNESMFDASAALLQHLHIVFNEVTRVPVPFGDLYPLVLSKVLKDVLAKVEHTYFIGTVDEASLTGVAGSLSAEDVTTRASDGKYTGMMIFAVDLHSGATLTRTESATLTRGFNRIASAQPVILFIRQGNELALSTCERSDYTQQWRDGEKLGKVSILRGINCNNPHRGHIDILASIGDKKYPNYEDLYKHWMEVFSSDLLTRKFYSELSDWYAWAVKVARFPNDLTTDKDDDKFNHESCIRLITRLIFVWFLKQKHLIPEEFFDERYIREHFIDEFNPHKRRNLLYNPDESKYYRLILQNLFFAILNCPIVAEGKDTPNNRRFRGDGQKGFLREGYNVNNLLRYKADFKEGGADEFVKMANSHVPFLNGGLFDCLDKKPEKLYYDGFSERKESLEQLYLPDWLFFGDEVGRSIDLSKWYGDNNKKNVSARGIIDILKRYNFTIEENTPLDQEVSLDPELLGKAFENLLAAYNPETKTSARKQTGSFYTPREIVQYMVDESLVAHLKRTCGDELETEYRKLLSYSTEETTLDEEQRKAIMKAVYDCRVLDPACGSGAFPMGILQQLVHILRQLDPTNEMWKDFMIDHAIEQSKLAFAENEEDERKARLADIEEAFNKSINDPDYARKLYLIEHCIYGVDIQPIAVQISKLRFFISLVVDQKPTNNPALNFGIRPLPNLESKFVAANTLIPVKYNGELVESNPDVRKYKEKLKELNHKIFLARRNIDKEKLKTDILNTRMALANAIETTGFVEHSEAKLLAGWDMFDQNASSSYFDAEWMFGVKGGFDIVIANPPYIRRTKIEEADKYIYEKIVKYHSAKGQYDMYLLFLELGVIQLCQGGILCYINPIRFFNSDYGFGLRSFVSKNCIIHSITDVSQLSVFENAMTYPCVLLLEKELPLSNTISYWKLDSLKDIDIAHYSAPIEISQASIIKDNLHRFLICNNIEKTIISKIESISSTIGDYFDSKRGLPNAKVDFDIHIYPALKSKMVKKYELVGNPIYVYTDFVDDFVEEMVIMPRTVKQLQVTLKPKDIILLDRIYYLVQDLHKVYIPARFVIGVLNAKITNFWFECNYNTAKVSGNFFDLNGDQIKSIPIPVPVFNNANLKHQQIINIVDNVLMGYKNKENTMVMESKIDTILYHLYNLSYEEVLIVDPETPITREEFESTIKAM